MRQLWPKLDGVNPMTPTPREDTMAEQTEQERIDQMFAACREVANSLPLFVIVGATAMANPLGSNLDRADERDDLDERTALVWDGTLTREPITWAEAEQIARQQIQQRGQLPLKKD